MHSSNNIWRIKSWFLFSNLQHLARKWTFLQQRNRVLINFSISFSHFCFDWLLKRCISGKTQRKSKRTVRAVNLWSFNYILPLHLLLTFSMYSNATVKRNKLFEGEQREKKLFKLRDFFNNSFNWIFYEKLN